MTQYCGSKTLTWECIRQIAMFAVPFSITQQWQIHSVHWEGGVCLSACWDTTPGRRPPEADPRPPEVDTPLEAGTPPAQCMLEDTVNKRVVCILLECNLVLNSVLSFMFLNQSHLCQDIQKKTVVKMHAQLKYATKYKSAMKFQLL